MDMGTLKIARSLLDQLRLAIERRDAVRGFKVLGVVIDRSDDPSARSITLQKGQHGCGSVTSIGFPVGLQDALSKAFFDYFEDEVQRLRAELQAIGITDVPAA